MAKDAPASPIPVDAPDMSMSLSEYCTRKSADSRDVEMIGGFYAEATAKGLHKDVFEVFEAAYETFANRPA